MAKRPAAKPNETVLDVDVCAIGAGSGGLSITHFATAIGLSCVLIERGAMGGDCLNGGCVPSKALLAAAHAAAAARRAHEFGVDAAVRRISSRGVYRHVGATVASIAPNDSQERYEGFGATVIREEARFVGPREIAAGPYRVRARWIFVATGARAAIPPIRGIDTVPYLTNETIFSLKALPRHLVIIGAGPLGVEMAQAHRRLGARVTLLEQAKMLPGEDPELVDHLRRRLVAEGVDIVEGASVERVSAARSGIDVAFSAKGKKRVVRGSHLLVAAGRSPQIESLSLDAAGIRHTARGIVVDKHLRTANSRVFAVGDVIGSTQLSHLAVHHAVVAFANAVHRAGKEVAIGTVPRVLYTEPELAQVGLRESEARELHGDIQVLSWHYDHNDRAAAERTPWGMIKVMVNRRGLVLGAGIVGPHAGEVVQKWALAISAGLDIQAVATMIAPYPTIGYSDRKLAESFAGPALLAKYRKRYAAAKTNAGASRKRRARGDDNANC